MSVDICGVDGLKNMYTNHVKMAGYNGKMAILSLDIDFMNK